MPGRVPGEDEGGRMGRTDRGSASARRRVTPSSQRRGGEGHGAVGTSEDGEIWKRGRASQRNTSFQPSKAKVILGWMDGPMRWGVGKHWDSHFGDYDFVSKRWPMEGLDG